MGPAGAPNRDFQSAFLGERAGTGSGSGSPRWWPNLAPNRELLPARPQSVFTLRALLRRSPVDLQQASRVIRYDPGLAAEVLRLANASLADAAEEVLHIDRAMVLVGLDNLKTLTLTAPMVSSLAGGAFAREWQELWQHSCLTGTFTQCLCADSDRDPEEGYLAGLLHDLGKWPLLITRERLEGDGMYAGMDHTAMGAWVAAAWRLPISVADAMEHHHQPEKARWDPGLVAVVAAANELAHLWCTPATDVNHPRIQEVLELHRKSLRARSGDLLPRLETAYLGWREECEQWVRETSNEEVGGGKV